MLQILLGLSLAFCGVLSGSHLILRMSVGPFHSAVVIAYVGAFFVAALGGIMAFARYGLLFQLCGLIVVLILWTFCTIRAPFVTSLFRLSRGDQFE